MQRTFRLFISSPFNDFKNEREILHKKVFPKISDYCNKNDVNFQPIDLRWGVNAEAQLDQKTLEVCLEEVSACKHFINPNFLIMTGNRYGYVPLPYMIEQIEFESILEQVENTKDKKLLLKWYILDENQIYIKKENEESSAYILKTRTDEYIDYSIWEKEENSLRRILQDSVSKVFNEDEIEYQKYFISATEAEVIEGILDYKKITPSQKTLLEKEIIKSSKFDKKFIFGYTRNIKSPTKSYIDVNDDTEKSDKLNKKAEEFKKNITQTLDSQNMLHLDFSTVENYESSKLKEFEKFIYEKLIKAIEVQQKEMNRVSIIKQETSEQQKFRNDKLKGFKGREKTLKAIQDYISKEDTKQPLVIHGPSGMGKSSLVAAAIEYRYICDLDLKKIRTIDDEHILYRFVGATKQTTTIRNLLISICNELINEDKKSNEYELEEYKFNEQIKDIFSNIKSPTTIFIDALDQLLHQDFLEWLPEKSNPNLKIILSVLNDTKYEKSGGNHYYKLLSNRVSDEYLLDILEDSLENEKELLIENLLKDLNRKLNPIQEKYLLDRWKETNYSPLYLKIAIEEVKHWKSYDYTDKELISNKQETEHECNIVKYGSLQELQTGVEGIIKEYIENLSKLFHHERAIVNKVFGYIHASKDGLSEKELIEILSEDLEDNIDGLRDRIINEFHEPIKVKNPRRENKEELVLPMSIWSRLHTQIKPFIIERNIDNQPLMKFFHRQFTTVIDDLTKENQKQLHTKLSEYFYTLQNKNETWDKRYHNLHMLSEYPYQLFHSKQSKELKEILFDFEFAGSVYDNDKQDSFMDIMGKASQLDDISEDEIFPWESFYRDNQNKIEMFNNQNWKSHQTLYQLAYEDGKDSPITNEAFEIFKKNRINFSWFRNLRINPNFIRSNLERTITLKSELDNNYELFKFNEKLLVLKKSKIDGLHIEKSFDLNFKEILITNEIKNQLKEYLLSDETISKEQIKIENYIKCEPFHYSGEYATLEQLQKEFNDGRDEDDDVLNWSPEEFITYYLGDDYWIEECDDLKILNNKFLWIDEEKAVCFDQVKVVKSFDDLQYYKQEYGMWWNYLLFYKNMILVTAREEIEEFSIYSLYRNDTGLLVLEYYCSGEDIFNFISPIECMLLKESSGFYDNYKLYSKFGIEDLNIDEINPDEIIYLGNNLFTTNNEYLLDGQIIPGNVYNFKCEAVYISQNDELDILYDKRGFLIILKIDRIEIHRTETQEETSLNHLSRFEEEIEEGINTLDSSEIFNPLDINNFDKNIFTVESVIQEDCIRQRMNPFEILSLHNYNHLSYENYKNLFYKTIRYLPINEFYDKTITSSIGTKKSQNVIINENSKIEDKILFYKYSKFERESMCEKLIIHNVLTSLNGFNSRTIQIEDNDITNILYFPYKVTDKKDFIFAPLDIHDEEIPNPILYLDSFGNITLYQIMNGNKAAFKYDNSKIRKIMNEIEILPKHLEEFFSTQYLLYKLGKQSKENLLETEILYHEFYTGRNINNDLNFSETNTYEWIEYIEEIYVLVDFEEITEEILNKIPHKFRKVFHKLKEDFFEIIYEFLLTNFSLYIFHNKGLSLISKSYKQELVDIENVFFIDFFLLKDLMPDNISDDINLYMIKEICFKNTDHNHFINKDLITENQNKILACLAKKENLAKWCNLQEIKLGDLEVFVLNFAEEKKVKALKFYENNLEVLEYADFIFDDFIDEIYDLLKNKYNLQEHNNIGYIDELFDYEQSLKDLEYPLDMYE